jgi:hypothetical protein
VWDGNNIFLAHWNGKIWELAGTSFFDFKSKDVTHYHVLTMPDEPHLKGKLAYA